MYPHFRTAGLGVHNAAAAGVVSRVSRVLCVFSPLPLSLLLFLACVTSLCWTDDVDVDVDVSKLLLISSRKKGEVDQITVIRGMYSV